MKTITLSNEVENLISNSQYNEAVKLVQENFNLEFKAEFVENNYHFQGDKNKRDIYNITLKRGQRKYSFKFGQSIMNSQYYKDSVAGRTYTLNGGCRTGNFSIRDIEKYKSGGVNLTLIKGETPDLYSVLACLQKYDVGTFEDFCSDFGYEEDSRTAKKTYKAVVKEYDKICSLFNNEELEILQLIN